MLIGVCVVAARVHSKYKKEKTELLADQRKEKYERTQMKDGTGTANAAGNLNTAGTDREQYGSMEDSAFGLDNRG